MAHYLAVTEQVTFKIKVIRRIPELSGFLKKLKPEAALKLVLKWFLIYEHLYFNEQIEVDSLNDISLFLTIPAKMEFESTVSADHANQDFFLT